MTGMTKNVNGEEIPFTAEDIAAHNDLVAALQPGRFAENLQKGIDAINAYTVGYMSTIGTPMPFQVGGNTYTIQTDPLSISFIEGEIIAINNNIRQDGEIFRVQENINCPVTNAQIIQIGTTARAFVKKCRQTGWQLKQNFRALTKIEDMQNFKVASEFALILNSLQ